jgi:hypothetical protein
VEASWLRIGVFDLTSAQERPMTDAPASPLRRRMIEDMTIRKFAPRTQEGFIRAVRSFSAFPRGFAGHGELRGRSPLSAAFGLERRRRANHQPHSDSVAFFLHGDAAQA